jgi:hypothetical protein
LINFAQTRSLPVRIASLFALHEFLDELSPIQRDTLRTAASRLEGPADYTPMMDLCRGLYGDSAAIPNLLRHLPRSRHAALALGLLGNATTEVLDALWCQLKRTKDPAAQRNITFALTMLRARDVDIYVEDRLTTARTFADQASWIETIGRVGTHIHVPALIAILHDTRRSVALRAAAVQALGRMGDLRPHSPFPEATHVFAPGLEEPRIDTWLAQR